MPGKTLSQIEQDVTLVSNLYAESYNIERDSSWYLCKLTEELGELAAADLRCSNKARPCGKTRDELKQARADEAADVFAHLLLFCRDRNIDLEAAVRAKWMKHLKP